MRRTLQYLLLPVLMLKSCQNPEEGVTDSPPENRVESINLEGQWLHVRTEINYDGIIHSEPKDSPFFIFEGDSLWYGYYPYYTYYSLEFSQKGDTIIDDLGKPMFIVDLKDDTLIMRDLDARMISRDYWIKADFNQAIIEELKTNWVSWGSHHHLWEFEASDIIDEEDCDFPDGFTLDLRAENAQNYFFEGDNVHFIQGRDTVSFSHISSDSSTLETLHLCGQFMTMHSYDFRRKR